MELVFVLFHLASLYVKTKMLYLCATLEVSKMKVLYDTDGQLIFDIHWKS